jgi:hypothetical protein
MAYLYRKDRSPFWYVVFFDAQGKERHRSTQFRADDPNQTSQAKALRAELEAKELRRAPGTATESWDSWVLQFLQRHCKSEKTLVRYSNAWKWTALWMQRERIQCPRQLTYKRSVEYLDWRTSFKKRTGKTVGRNTAILELKTLSLIMGEAVRLGHAEANPLVHLNFIKLKMPHLCFHCLRVTYVNRLRRVGVPREAAMRLVNHASELVHQIYQREKVEDVEQWKDAVQFPG